MVKSGHVIPELAGEGIHCDDTSSFRKFLATSPRNLFHLSPRRQGRRRALATLLASLANKKGEINCVDSTVEIRGPRVKDRQREGETRVCAARIAAERKKEKGKRRAKGGAQFTARGVRGYERRRDSAIRDRDWEKRDEAFGYILLFQHFLFFLFSPFLPFRSPPRPSTSRAQHYAPY